MLDVLRGLTLHQPWAWACGVGIKLIENRPWLPPAWMVNQRFAIHAGQVWDDEAARLLGELIGPFGPAPPTQETRARGAIVATATLGGVVLDRAAAEAHAGVGQSRFFFGRYGWILRDVVTLPKPLPCRGYQKLWRLPVGIAAQVREAEAAARAGGAG